MNDARFFHERNVKLCRYPADDRSIIAGETRGWWVGMRCAPEVVAGIRKKIGLRLVEVRCCATVLLRKNHLVEEFDLGILTRSALTFMDELIESLSLLQDSQVLHVLCWLSFHKLLHLELVVHSRLLAVTSSRYKESPVRVKQTGETSHERCAHLVGSKSSRADNADGGGASSVDVCGTSCVGLGGSYIRGWSETYQNSDKALRPTFLRKSSRKPCLREASIAGNDLPATAQLPCCARVGSPCRA